MLYFRVSRASAVIFHARDLNATELPPRSAAQFNVFFNLESPYNSGEAYKRVPKDYFNLSMTYRRDSRIYWPYDWLKKSDENATARIVASGGTSNAAVADAMVTEDEVLTDFLNERDASRTVAYYIKS